MHFFVETMEEGVDHALHLAAWRGDLPEVQRIITEHPALMELSDGANRSPLLLAAERGHTAMVEWLLDQGADMEAQAMNGWDALYVASHGGHTAVVSVLLDRGLTSTGELSMDGYL